MKRQTCTLIKSIGGVLRALIDQLEKLQDAKLTADEHERITCAVITLQATLLLLPGTEHKP